MKDLKCPLKLPECLRGKCRYYNLVTGCVYERQRALDDRRKRTEEAARKLRLSDQPLKGETDG